jgi:hypothetical protein
MSSQNYTYTSQTFYSSSSTSNGQKSGHAYHQTTHSDPYGTHVQTTSQNLGEPPVQDIRSFDSAGRPIAESGRTIGAGSRDAGRIQAVEEVEDEKARK